MQLAVAAAELTGAYILGNCTLSHGAGREGYVSEDVLGGRGICAGFLFTTVTRGALRMREPRFDPILRAAAGVAVVVPAAAAAGSRGMISSGGSGRCFED
jgi:hypothetical protein